MRRSLSRATVSDGQGRSYHAPSYVGICRPGMDGAPLHRSRTDCMCDNEGDEPTWPSDSTGPVLGNGSKARARAPPRRRRPESDSDGRWTKKLRQLPRSPSNTFPIALLSLHWPQYLTKANKAMSQAKSRACLSQAVGTERVCLVRTNARGSCMDSREVAVVQWSTGVGACTYTYPDQGARR